MSDTKFLDITKPEDLEYIESQLRRLIDENPKGMVTIQFTMDPQRLLALLGWIYNFWLFGKKYFFPEGKFRKPKLVELKRNWKIVTGVLMLKNLLIGIWKARDEAAEQIGNNIKSLVEKSEK